MAKQKPNLKLIRNLYNFSPVMDDDEKMKNNGFFSQAKCDTCGDTLAGSRYYCTAQEGTKRIGKPGELKPDRVELEVCVDCYVYFFG